MIDRSVERIEATDEEIEAAVEAASVPALMMSMIQMSGETGLLEGAIRPRPPEMLDVQLGLTPEEQAVMRKEALQVIRAYRDAGCPPAPPPSSETIDRMLAFLAGEPRFPEALRGLVLEELDLEGSDPRRARIDPEAIRRAGSDFHVILIGAGMSGLLVAFRLKQEGVPFTILEKNPGVGGTWFENRYPGCRVDIASHAYSFSFDPGEWQHLFGVHGEVRDYFARIAREYGLLDHIVFGAEVERATFDEASGRWHVEYRHEGRAASASGNVLVSAVGQLNRPKIPEIPGRESFRGPQMHTACWDPGFDERDRHVAVAGSGASAFQLVPELARSASRVTVFQRSPQWMLPNPDYHDAIPEAHEWCFHHLPGYARWYRVITIWGQLDKAEARVEIDPTWDDGGLSASAVNRALRDQLVGYMESQIQEPGLLEKVVPDYPPMGTRMLQDNGSWLATLQRPNVELVPTAIERVTETGVVAEDGQEIAVDAIVWATGFHADRFLWPLEVEGRDGALLSRAWSDLPRAYLGISIPGFPNLFCLYGPNTNVAHTANVILISELQASHVLSGIKRILEHDLATIECREETAREYESRLSEALERRVWSHPKVHGFYRNASGRVVVNMPWSAADYWQWTRELDPADYLETPREVETPVGPPRTRGGPEARRTD